MLKRVEALNYKALRYVDQTLGAFQVLIGPNASGKSTFLDVLNFIADAVSKPSLADAVWDRSTSMDALTWMGSAEWLELAVEADIPSDLGSSYSQLRYEVRIGTREEISEPVWLAENLWLMTAPDSSDVGGRDRQPMFPSLPDIPERITVETGKRTPAGRRKVISKIEGGNDYFRSELTDWNNLFRLGPRRSALANLPEDEDRFPVAVWFKRYITEGIQKLMLNSQALRRPSPPQSPHTFLPDGSNLPWVIHDLEQNHPERLLEWVDHIRTALPDLDGISTVERPEDRHRYLQLRYATGLTIPSWVVSDGTLRMLALTILAYLPNVRGIYLIEEPENGIHPQSVETVFQSLCSVYNAQVLLATHSTVILGLTEPEQLLCFARTSDGETAIVRGDEHPRLADWKGEMNLSTLFAAGVLG